MSDEKPGKRGFWRSLEVLGQAAASSKPCEGAFDDPAAGQELEAFDTRRPLYDLDRPRTTVGERICQLVTPINPIRKNMVQSGIFVSEPLQQRNRTVAILNVCRVDMSGEQKSVRVGDNMPFAAVDTLARIIPARATGVSRRGALAVNYRRRGL